MKTTDLLDNIEKLKPEHYINENEINDIIYTFGSLVSILKNKKINQTSLLAILLDDESLRNLLLEYSEIENFYIIVTHILRLYPNLARSKIIKLKYKKYIKNDRKRKTNL